ncbi:MAG: hypothetical protein M0Z98_02110 [Actinomycetales bacterium]|nr:hypothetical protein [Actinomycetales bacterium]
MSDTEAPMTSGAVVVGDGVPLVAALLDVDVEAVPAQADARITTAALVAATSTLRRNRLPEDIASSFADLMIS